MGTIKDTFSKAKGNIISDYAVHNLFNQLNKAIENDDREACRKNVYALLDMGGRCPTWLRENCQELVKEMKLDKTELELIVESLDVSTDEGRKKQEQNLSEQRMRMMAAKLNLDFNKEDPDDLIPGY